MSKLCHFEIPAKDLEKSKKFYEDLFGWGIELTPQMNYGMISIEDGIGGGLSANAKPSADDGISLFFEVDDIPGSLARAVELGGTDIKPKTEIGGDHGFFGVFGDPDGNQIGVWSKS